MLLSPTPDERDPRYFRTWQRVSIGLQKSFREWAREVYFRDAARFEDREAAFTMLVFSACRPFYGRPRSEFTYDLAEPAATLAAALRSSGAALRSALAPIEKRLREAGSIELAHRFAPVWYRDIQVAAKKHQRELIRMLAHEARLIDAVIDLGTRRNEKAEERFYRIADNMLSNFGGADLRELIPKILEETARALAENARGSRGHLVHRGVRQRRNARAAGSPDGRIGAHENRDHGRPDGCGQMTDAGIIADINARGGEPASQVV